MFLLSVGGVRLLLVLNAASICAAVEKIAMWDINLLQAQYSETSPNTNVS